MTDPTILAPPHPLPDDIPRVAEVGATVGATPVRVNSRALLGSRKMIEIEHEGRVYQLRLTQRNKLILTA